MLKALKRNELVVMLLDQVIAAKHGVFVPFFNRPASTSPALSAAARRTGAPLFVVVSRREGDLLVLEVEGPVPFDETLDDFEAEVRSHVGQVTALLERFIRKAPEQWLWLHRRWKVQPPQSGSGLTTNTGREL
jgi:KDO2-lipid IV(A) lauroyltransferase